MQLMINVDSNYRLVNDLLSKNNGAFISFEEYTRYAAIASDSLFDDIIGADNTSVVSYGRNRTLDARLMPFRVMNQPILLVAGIGTLPTDWAKTNAVRLPDGTPVHPVDEDRRGMGKQDYYARPSESRYVYYEGNGNIEVEPVTTDVVMDYLKRPTPPVYAYTMSTGSRPRPVYDPVNSVDFDWDARQENDLTIRILELCGVSMDKGSLVQYTNTIKRTEE